MHAADEAVAQIML